MENIKQDNPLLAVDAVLFSVINDSLKVLLIQINGGAYDSRWAIPGGLVKNNENLDHAISRILSKKANINHVYLEQLYTFGDPKRDKRGHSVSVAYFALISDPDKLNVKTMPYYKNIRWFDVKKLPNLAFDHKHIIEVAHERLETKLSYTNIAYSLLPKKFTLAQLKHVYEVIYGKKIDKRNFRKSVLTKGLVEETGEVQSDVPHRPAKLYKFRRQSLQFFE